MAADGKYRARAAAGLASLHQFYDSANGVWRTTGWWNSANALETTIDYIARTGDSTYAGLIANSFDKNIGTKFLNRYYDDEGWWALAWIKAYDLTKETRYLDAARAIFDDMSVNGWSSVCGGGIWWNKNNDKKNAIANELFLNVAARLHLRTPGDGGPNSCLDYAQRAWAWFEASGMINADDLVNDGLDAGCANDGGITWTYNQGVILGGLVALHEAAHDAALLTKAKAIADAALATLADAGGVLHEPNEPNLGADGPQFKGVFMRNLCDLYAATSEPAYRDAILANADSIWSRNRTEAYEFGALWAGPFDTADASRQSSAMDALNGALLFDAPGSAYQAESGVLRGLTTESTHPGFHGTGYVAGWNRDGQSVELTVDVPSAGLHDFVLRYAAVGDAVRHVRLNGSLLAIGHRFAKTGSWNTWATTAIYDAPLTAGANTVSIAFEQERGSSGYLNLDELAVL